MKSTKDPRWDDDWLMTHCEGFTGDVDSWPYREMFESYARAYKEHTGRSIATYREVYLRCIYLRKKRFSTPVGEKSMPHFEEHGLPHAVLTPKEEKIFIDLYAAQPMDCDRLPYSNSCGQLLKAFMEKTETEYPLDSLWRCLLHLRKTERLPLKGKKAALEARMTQGFKGF